MGGWLILNKGRLLKIGSENPSNEIWRSKSPIKARNGLGWGLGGHVTKWLKPRRHSKARIDSGRSLFGPPTPTGSTPAVHIFQLVGDTKIITVELVYSLDSGHGMNSENMLTLSLKVYEIHVQVFLLSFYFGFQIKYLKLSFKSNKKNFPWVNSGPAGFAVILKTGYICTKEGRKLPRAATSGTFITHLIVQNIRFNFDPFVYITMLKLYKTGRNGSDITLLRTENFW